MDKFSPVKAEASSRRHPEDDHSNGESDIESSNSSNNNNNNNSNKNNIVLSHPIPGTGSKDMPILHSSQLVGSYQTGVKGVIADATSFESARRKIRKQKPESNYSGYVAAEIDPRTPLNRGSDIESDDEDFIQTWRKNRLAELRIGGAAARRRSPSKRKYGVMESVDPVGYLDAIEKISSDTIVVVTIYNDHSEDSRFVEECMNTLCRRYITTRFIRLHHYDAEIDAAMAPAVLAYKGGELFANIMRIIDEIPTRRNLSPESLEQVLRRADVLRDD